MTSPQRDDIPLETPVARHPDVVPAVEDRSYIIFIAGAMAAGLLGGFALGIAVGLAQAGIAWSDRTPWLIQAHGWAQLQGWTGLFVAGMGFRLLPRFAGRRPLPKPVNVAVFIPLFLGVVIRAVAQPGAGNAFSEAGLFTGHLLWAAGAAGFAGVLLYTLVLGRAGWPAWRVFAFAGALCWIAWAALTIEAAFEGLRHDAFVPPTLDDPAAWMVMLAAAGNFIWAVQSRSVPIFYGRKTPSFKAIAVPFVLLNAGAALFVAAAWIESPETHARLMGSAFVTAGLATAWLAPVAGSCWGSPKRLRPRARAAARFVLLANIAAVVCGLLLAWAGSRTLIDGQLASIGLRDAARHAFGVGVITMLIVGMAQLVAPFFALQRVESRGALLLDRGLLVLLVAATLLRIAAGLLTGHLDSEPRAHLTTTSGVLAWFALALFAFMVIRAVRDEPRVKASLATIATRAANSS